MVTPSPEALRDIREADVSGGRRAPETPTREEVTRAIRDVDEPRTVSRIGEPDDDRPSRRRTPERADPSTFAPADTDEGKQQRVAALAEFAGVVGQQAAEEESATPNTVERVETLIDEIPARAGPPTTDDVPKAPGPRDLFRDRLNAAEPGSQRERIVLDEIGTLLGSQQRARELIPELEAEARRLGLDPAEFNLNAVVRDIANQIREGRRVQLRQVAENLRREQAQEERLSVSTVQLPSGERVDREQFESLTEQQQTVLRAVGTSGFRQFTEAERARFEADTVLLDTGERVNKRDFDELGPVAQDQLKEFGIEAFNARLLSDFDIEPAPTPELPIPLGPSDEGVQEGPPDSGLVRLQSGEFVQADTFFTLRPDERAILFAEGTEQFNRLQDLRAQIFANERFLTEQVPIQAQPFDFAEPSEDVVQQPVIESEPTGDARLDDLLDQYIAAFEPQERVQPTLGGEPFPDELAFVSPEFAIGRQALKVVQEQQQLIELRRLRAQADEEIRPELNQLLRDRLSESDYVGVLRAFGWVDEARDFAQSGTDDAAIQSALEFVNSAAVQDVESILRSGAVPLPLPSGMAIGLIVNAVRRSPQNFAAATRILRRVRIQVEPRTVAGTGPVPPRVKVTVKEPPPETIDFTPRTPVTPQPTRQAGTSRPMRPPPRPVEPVRPPDRPSTTRPPGERPDPIEIARQRRDFARSRDAAREAERRRVLEERTEAARAAQQADDAPREPRFTTELERQSAERAARVQTEFRALEAERFARRQAEFERATRTAQDAQTAFPTRTTPLRPSPAPVEVDPPVVPVFDPVRTPTPTRPARAEQFEQPVAPFDQEPIPFNVVAIDPATGNPVTPAPTTTVTPTQGTDPFRPVDPALTPVRTISPALDPVTPLVPSPDPVFRLDPEPIQIPDIRPIVSPQQAPTETPVLIDVVIEPPRVPGDPPTTPRTPPRTPPRPPTPTPRTPVNRRPPRRATQATEIPRGLTPSEPGGAFPLLQGWKQGGGKRKTRRGTRTQGVFAYVDRRTGQAFWSSRPLFGRVPTQAGLTPKQSHRVIRRSRRQNPVRAIQIGNAVAIVGDRGPRFRKRRRR